MPNSFDRVDGWEIQVRSDGSFAVGDAHGLVAGPFGTKSEAIAAALRLPKLAPYSARPDQRQGRQG